MYVNKWKQIVIMVSTIFNSLLKVPSAKHKLFIGLCQLLNNLLRYNNDYVGVTYTGHHIFIIHVQMNTINKIDHNLIHT